MTEYLYVRTRGLLIAIPAIVWSSPTLAYIDPASGSLLIQGIIAFFVGAAFTIKMFYRTRIRPLWDRLRGRSSSEGKPSPKDQEVG